MADIHLWDSASNKTIWKSVSTFLHPTLCGVHVAHPALAWEEPTSKEPTCMGCILVKFQEEAEQDGS
jgi:hypothetical protein